MDIVRAFAYYRTSYLLGVARPGALVHDGERLSLYDNQLALVWDAPLADVRVTKGMGILRVRIRGEEASILTAVGGWTSPRASAELTALLASGAGIPGAPSMGAAQRVSVHGVPDPGAYVQGQRALRQLFTSLGVLD